MTDAAYLIGAAAGQSIVSESETSHKLQFVHAGIKRISVYILSNLVDNNERYCKTINVRLIIFDFLNQSTLLYLNVF